MRCVRARVCIHFIYEIENFLKNTLSNLKNKNPTHLGYILGNFMAFDHNLWLHRNCFTHNFILTSIDTTTIVEELAKMPLVRNNGFQRQTFELYR